MSTVNAGPRYLLDTLAGQNTAAAYSLRRLRSSYTGAAIRVRRSNDNAEQDIAFDANGNLDEAALTAFVGANSGFVTTWYDQSGTKNLIQATAASQPRIINSGVVDRDNGKVNLFFNGSQAIGSTDTGLPTGNATYITVSKSTNTSLNVAEYRCIFNYGIGNFYASVFVLYGDDANFGNDALGVSQYGDATGIANRLNNTNLFFVTKPSTTGIWNLWVNNSLTASKNMITSTALNNGATSFNVGAYNSSTGVGSWFTGYIGEIIIYGSNQSSNRTGIENNINTYYSIY